MLKLKLKVYTWRVRIMVKSHYCFTLDSKFVLCIFHLTFFLYPCSHLFFFFLHSDGSAYSFLKFPFCRHLLSKFFLAILISCRLLSPDWLLFCMLSWFCIWYLKSHLSSFLSGFLQPLSQLISHIWSSYALKIPSQATLYFLWNLFLCLLI